MTLKITPGSQGSIESDGHVVLLPAGLTGSVTLADGTAVDLGPSDQIAVEVDSYEKAKEVGLLASELAGKSDDLPDVKYDAKQSKSNLKGD